MTATKNKPYTDQFFDTLRKHLVDLETKLDTNKEGGIISTQRNTQLVAKALHLTFCDMGDVAGMLGIGAAIKTDLID